MTVKNVKTLCFFLGGGVFQDRVSLPNNSPGCSGTRFVDQASLKTLTHLGPPAGALVKKRHEPPLPGRCSVFFFFFGPSSVSMNHSVVVLPLKVGQR